jgi:hypothetical protein
VTTLRLAPPSLFQPSFFATTYKSCATIGSTAEGELACALQIKGLVGFPPRSRQKPVSGDAQSSNSSVEKFPAKILNVTKQQVLPGARWQIPRFWGKQHMQPRNSNDA